MSYGYDAGSELTGINYELAGESLGNLTYAYDQDGRRIQMAGSWARTGMPNPTISTAVYNAANELTNWNGATLTYDGNGNLLSDGANTYGWNERNQLDSISGTTAASFEYGPFGRRLGKTINGNTTNFLYDGVNPVQELVGGSPSANLLTGLGVDEYFTRTDLTGTSNFLSDALGSTIGRADASGAVQTEYTYDPFGGTTTQGAANANSFQFTGRENDGDGLYFYRARYYSPMFSRFVSEDHLGRSGSGRNLFVYAGDNPSMYDDPLGLDKWDPLKQAVCSATGPLRETAAGNHGAEGVGFGGSGGVGLVFGVSGTGGAEVVADPEGNVGIAITLGGNPGVGVLGVGANGGAQVVVTNAQNIGDLKGTSIGGGAAAGPFSVEVTHALDNGTASVTGTVGPGIGGKVVGAEVTHTWVVPVASCGQSW